MAWSRIHAVTGQDADRAGSNGISLLLFSKTVYSDPLASIYGLDAAGLRKDDFDTDESIDYLKERSTQAEFAPVIPYLQVISELRREINSGVVVPFAVNHPNYSYAQESKGGDDVESTSVEQAIRFVGYALAIGSADPELVWDALGPRGLKYQARSDPKAQSRIGAAVELGRRIFWSEHLPGRYDIIMRDAAQARWYYGLVNRLHQSIAEKFESRMLLSKTFRPRFGFAVDNVSADDIREVAANDQVVLEFRSIVDDVERLFLASHQSSALDVCHQIEERLSDWAGNVERVRRSSNFLNSFVVPSRSAILAAAGAVLGGYIGGDDIIKMGSAALGALTPLLVELPLGARRSKTERNQIATLRKIIVKVAE